MAASHYLDPLFAPSSVALIGASEKGASLGRIVYENLLAGGYQGKLFAVNPKHRRVLDRPSFPAIAALPQAIDLAVICAPPDSIASILPQAAGRVRAAAILSGAPAATAAGYALWWRALRAQARAASIRIVGPASFGVVRTAIGLNATYSAVSALPGRLTLISQSGAVCSALLEFGRSAGIGFQSVIALGAVADLDFGELLDYALADPDCDAIVLYIETLREARAFLSALRAAARTKPVIVLKAGRHVEGAERDGDIAFDAALKRAGTVRVHSYAQLFAAARMLSSGRIPRGNRLTIITNGRGPGLLAADHVDDTAAVLADLSPATVAALAALLPPGGRIANPIDVRGEATPERFAAAARAALADAHTDALLVLHVAVPAAPAVETAVAVAAVAKGANKPVLAAWLGAVDQPQARVALEAGGAVNFITPETAVDAFSYLAAYRRNQEWLLEAPPPQPELSAPDLAAAARISARAAAAQLRVLDAVDAASLLVAFAIPVARVAAVSTLPRALNLARELGYPVALERADQFADASSQALRDGRMLKRAWATLHESGGERPTRKRPIILLRQVIDGARCRHARIAVRTDPVFGPLIGYGPSGAPASQMAWMLPPLNRRLAIDLIAAARVAGSPADVQPLVAVLLEVSALACALPWVVTLDIDPLIVSPVAAIAARVNAGVDSGRSSLAAGYRHMAIHPYPVELESRLVLPSGRALHVRPIRPEDAAMEIAFVAAMSEESRYRRFMQHLPGLTPQMLARFTQVDYDRELALVALEPTPSGEAIAAVARYVANPDNESAEFAIAVSDDWQGRGLGCALLLRLIDCATARGFRRLVGVVLAENAPMQALARKLGFVVRADHDDAEQVIATLELRRTQVPGVQPAGSQPIGTQPPGPRRRGA